MLCTLIFNENAGFPLVRKSFRRRYKSDDVAYYVTASFAADFFGYAIDIVLQYKISRVLPMATERANLVYYGYLNKTRGLA